MLSECWYLFRAGRYFVSLQDVDDPHGEVADEEEGDHLSAWLVSDMGGG